MPVASHNDQLVKGEDVSAMQSFGIMGRQEQRIVLLCFRSVFQLLGALRPVTSANKKRIPVSMLTLGAAFPVMMLVAWLIIPGSASSQDRLKHPERTLILVHYMPWFQSHPVSGHWGWHWTMNHFDPAQMTGELRQIASHYYPVIGPYDSSDDAVLEYHLLLMKLAGIDGVIVDWYGLSQFRDYPVLHRNTDKLIRLAERFEMKFAICYEDQTISALVESGRLQSDQRVSHATAELNWLAGNWYIRTGYVKLNGNPLLLSFGHNGLKDDDWTACLTNLKNPVAYFSEHVRRTAAVGAFDWPVPQEGIPAIDRFLKRSQDWQQSIPVAYPRFKDIYAEAQLHESYGQIDDQQGNTLSKTLEKAISARGLVVQISTWNDWGEGTQIEPSKEFGYRDLETVQALRKQHIDSNFPYRSTDLKLPERLYHLRMRTTAENQIAELDGIALALCQGKLKEADAAMRALE